MKKTVAAFLLLLGSPASAQEPVPRCVPEPGGVCLTKDQRDAVVAAVKELDGIHAAKAEVSFKGEVVVVRDWDDRVYLNGGDKKPVRATLKLGDTVERDLEVVLPVRVYYREKPPEPMLRLRIRAQAGVLPGELVRGQQFKDSLDAGIGWDFFHLGPLNLSAYTGIKSLGGGLGLDATRNFGPYVGYSLTYDGFRSGVLAGAYFSFN